MYFGIPIWMGILAVLLSFLIATISVRATGETDINPVGAMGKITQVVYGALHPGADSDEPDGGGHHGGGREPVGRSDARPEGGLYAEGLNPANR